MKQYFCVGTYSEPILFGTGETMLGKGEGIYLCSFDEGIIEQMSVIGARNASFLCLNETDSLIYSVNELKEYMGHFGGGVSELAYDSRGQLFQTRIYLSLGTDPCHIAVSHDSRFLAVANFGSGSVTIFQLGKNGAILAEPQFIPHTGKSIDPVRQSSPHAHAVIFAPKDDRLYVPDLGTDEVVCYEWRDGMWMADFKRTISVDPGSGPRFGQFSADGKHFYLINELASSVSHYHFDDGYLELVGTISTLPDDYFGDNICSHLHLHPDGKMLYASNRGHDSIFAAKIDDGGRLSFFGRWSCQGKTPRNFAIEPSGVYLLVGNQDSDAIEIFKIQEDGCLEHFDSFAIPTPVCIQFFNHTSFTVSK